MGQAVTVQDDDVRASWKVGSVVEIFSASSKQWHKGTVTKILNDEEGEQEGEWLRIQYTVSENNDMRVKLAARENSDIIRPIQSQITQHKDNLLTNDPSLEIKTLQRELQALERQKQQQQRKLENILQHEAQLNQRQKEMLEKEQLLLKREHSLDQREKELMEREQLVLHQSKLRQNQITPNTSQYTQY
eukprot:245442_1